MTFGSADNSVAAGATTPNRAAFHPLSGAVLHGQWARGCVGSSCRGV